MYRIKKVENIITLSAGVLYIYSSMYTMIYTQRVSIQIAQLTAELLCVVNFTFFSSSKCPKWPRAGRSAVFLQEREGEKQKNKL